METSKEAHYRSILKALSWRVFGTASTILIVFAFTGRLALSFGVGVVEVVTKLLLYYFHERVWGLMGIGRKEHPLSSLPVEKPLEEQDMQEVKKKLEELGYISKV